MDLFDTQADHEVPPTHSPLAERTRPRRLEEFVGQEHLVGEGKALHRLIELDQVPSMLLWGPPGSGKTTLARIIARRTQAEFFQLSAVASGVKDVRGVLDAARENARRTGRRTILFIDEIHRFNKAQQDALLHSVEEGLITLIGATTENPSFEVIPPLLSRCRLYVLRPLTDTDLDRILDHAVATDPAFAGRTVLIEDRPLLMLYAGGDARAMLNGLETAARLADMGRGTALNITRAHIEEAFQRTHAKYDDGGEEHYNIVSAFIKSMRGCDPDGAVYWMARMLEGGEDPKFIARRMIVLASEDVGNADPMALTIATSAFTAVDYVGMPEARIILAQAATYLASAPKSNASYVAISEAGADVRQTPASPVPLHLRNAPTGLMAGLGYGTGYKYGHDHPGNFTEQQYLPDNLKDRTYYRPTDNGAERTIRERLNSWWKSRRR
jgi:putative ATPase